MVKVLIALVLGVTQVASSRPPRFVDYPAVEAFRGEPLSPVLASSEARRFRTELSRQSATGPNFAGHFTFARWGCGAGCVTGAIIDAVTGQVWFPKFVIEDVIDHGRIVLDHSTDFQLDSELVVAAGAVNDQGAGTAYFRWHENALTLIRFEKYSN
jgi:hypothetical protein